MYLYENHLGGLYTSKEDLDFKDLYCNRCGDNDWPLGEYKSITELLKLVREHKDQHAS